MELSFAIKTSCLCSRIILFAKLLKRYCIAKITILSILGWNGVEAIYKQPIISCDSNFEVKYSSFKSCYK